MTAITLDRPVPAFGGFTLTYLRIELMRKLRNRRAASSSPCVPRADVLHRRVPVARRAVDRNPVASGGVSVAAYIMVSMAMYGTMMSATQTGASVAVERAQGWSRQLRLTPLNPVANVVVKMLAE